MDIAQLAEEPTARHVGGEATVATAATSHTHQPSTRPQAVALVPGVARVGQVAARDLAGHVRVRRSCTRQRK